MHTEPAKTKSQYIVFGAHLLPELPTCDLPGQQFVVRSVTEHLGVVVSADLEGSSHAQPNISVLFDYRSHTSWANVPTTGKPRNSCPGALLHYRQKAVMVLTAYI